MTDHPLRQLRLRRSGCRRFGDQTARAQHGDAMRDTHHLAQFVTDEDDRQALFDHLAERFEKRLALLRRQHGGRLVEDQNAGAAIQGLQDLNALTLADGQARYRPVGLHRQPETLGDGKQLPARGGTPGKRLPQGLRPHQHVLKNGEVVGQRKMLMHHADAGRQRGRRIAFRQGLTVDHDIARIGHVMAEQN